MAKIFIRGIGEITILNDIAIRLDEQWRQGLLRGHKQHIENVSFEGSAINGFQLDDTSAILTSDGEYDLDIPSQREKVKEFEREYLDWVENNFDCEILDRRMVFMEKQGAILIKKKPTWMLSNHTVINSKKFKEITKLFASLSSLNQRRKKAKENETEALNRQIEEIKNQMTLVGPSGEKGAEEEK